MPNFPNINIVCSDDPLLRKEAVEERLAYGRYILPNAEFLLFTTTDFKTGGVGGANVKQMETEMSDPGLFGGDRIIKLNLSDADSTTVDVFNTIAANFRPGLFIVVEMPMIKKLLINAKSVDPSPLKRFLDYSDTGAGGQAFAKQQSGKSKEKKSRKGLEGKLLESFGYLKYLGADIVPLYAIEESRIRSWIISRAQRYGLELDNEALEFVASSADNNLLLIDQTLYVLGMTYPRTRLTANLVEKYLSLDSRYTGNELPLAIWQGDSLKALNIINSLCTSAGTDMGDGLRTLIRIMDEAINTIYEGRQMNLMRMPLAERRSFFLGHRVFFPLAQDAYCNVMQRWSPYMLQQATVCLSEAAQAFSSFDNEGAYRALQRLAMIPTVGNNPHLKYLSTQSELF